MRALDFDVKKQELLLKARPESNIPKKQVTHLKKSPSNYRILLGS